VLKKPFLPLNKPGPSLVTEVKVSQGEFKSLKTGNGFLTPGNSPGPKIPFGPSSQSLI